MIKKGRKREIEGYIERERVRAETILGANRISNQVRIHIWTKVEERNSFAREQDKQDRWSRKINKYRPRNIHTPNEASYEANKHGW